jgi:chromosome segregation ATPase
MAMDSPFSVPSSAPAPVPEPSGGGWWKFIVLFVMILGLIGASVFFYLQINEMRAELAQTRDDLAAQIASIHETSNVSSQTNKQRVDSLKKDVDSARQAASVLAGEAKVEATQHADALAAKLQAAQADQAKQVAAVSNEVSAVRTDADATKSRVGEVSTEVGTVKTDLTATKSELEKTISDLKRTNGDLGIQSGLIATNGKELAALRALGERNYTEFKLAKEKTPRKVGDIQMRLKAADPKKNRYTVEVIADDKLVEKKDKTVNEPVQFMLSRATLPYELVVNEVRKDMISGYVSAPKVQQTRSN